jgi:hypothetical protein
MPSSYHASWIHKMNPSRDLYKSAARIPDDQDIAGVTADGACDTRKCHDAIAERRAVAIMPPRKNAKAR